MGSYEYNLKTLEDVYRFCEENKGDRKPHYIWGAPEGFADRLYTIEQLKKEACPEWFEGMEDSEEAWLFEFDDEAALEYGVLHLYGFVADGECFICDNDDEAWDKVQAIRGQSIEAVTVSYHVNEYETLDLLSESGFDGEGLNLAHMSDEQKKVLLMSDYNRRRGSK